MIPPGTNIDEWVRGHHDGFHAGFTGGRDAEVPKTESESYQAGFRSGQQGAAEALDRQWPTQLDPNAHGIFDSW